jgi:hypothetical protein
MLRACFREFADLFGAGYLHSLFHAAHRWFSEVLSTFNPPIERILVLFGILGLICLSIPMKFATVAANHQSELSFPIWCFAILWVLARDRLCCQPLPWNHCLPFSPCQGLNFFFLAFHSDGSFPAKAKQTCFHIHTFFIRPLAVLPLSSGTFP